MSMIPRADLQVISDDVLLYKIGRTVYVNRMMGNCSGLTNGRTLVSNVWGSQVCRGDIARVADLNVGMITGSCAFGDFVRSEEHTSELQSLMRISYAVFCLKKKKIRAPQTQSTLHKH